MTRTAARPREDIERVAIVRFPTQMGPAVSLVLRSGQTVGLPDALYPDALGFFPSMRHQERARTVHRAITRMVERRAGAPGA